ncbi:hypothetical protein IWW38_004774 [Coemansia aciculifera]|uniref:Uncharacterized protein n=1 Tax=Coemansia aciculifera TaxID=417176 RepID=A0ACC1LXB1_9FUNG|nr:hypothetical protein IWW38_004774 [Coemansia aciculifera]
MDLQMWSANIWQPTAEEFEMYPSAVISLYGILHSSGHTELGIADIHKFVLSATVSGNSNIESLLAELSNLYWTSHISLDFSKENKVDNAETSTATFESLPKIATALEHAIGSANKTGKYAPLCKTNFAAIDMKQSPEGMWLINDYTTFKSTQALHGLPIPVRKLVPVLP